MRQLKKWLNSLLVVVLTLSMLAPAAVDAAEVEQEDINLPNSNELNEETVTSGDSSEIYIPDTIENVEVTPVVQTIEETIFIEGPQTAKPTVNLIGYTSGETVDNPNQVVQIEAQDSLGNQLVPVVKLNNIEVLPNADGKYEFTLKTGSNTVKIEATDNANQKTSKSWTLKFEAMAITIANYGEQRVFHDPKIKVDIDVAHYAGEEVTPVMTKSSEVIQPNEEGLYELTLDEGLNSYKIEATDSKGYTASMMYPISYSRIEVIDFMPGVGQFINQDTYTKDVHTKVRSKGGSIISLGGFGGYVTVKYDEPIKNDPNHPYGIDFTVAGNPFAVNGLVDVYNNEPAGVMVAKNPDGPWYHLAGSEYENADTIKNYELTYFAPTAQESNVVWTDNVGGTGKISGKNYPNKERFPMIPADKYTLSGVAIFNDVLGTDIGTVRKQVRYGYADAVPVKNTNYETPNNPYSPGIQGSGGDAMDISWAVDAAGNPVHLDEIQYVKVYTAVNKLAGAFGEVSPEIKDFGRSLPIESAVERITIKNLESTNWVPKGERLQFYLQAFDAAGAETAYPEVEWTSSNSEVAKVNKVSGQVRTYAPGTTMITAKLKNNPAVTAQFELTVKEEAVPVKMEVATTGTTFLATNAVATIFTATVYDQYGNVMQNQPIEWAVTNEDHFAVVKGFNNDSQKISLKPTEKTGSYTLTAKLSGLTSAVVITVADTSLIGTASHNGSVAKSAVTKVVDQAVTLNSNRVFFRITNTSASRTGDVVNFNNDALTYAKEKNKQIVIEGKEYRFALPIQLVADSVSTNKLRLTTTITAPVKEVKTASLQDVAVAESVAQVGKAVTIKLEQIVGTAATSVEQFEATEAAIKFTPEEVKDVDVAKLAAHVQLADGTWQNVGGTYNEATYELTFSAANPGKYAVFEVKDATEPALPEQPSAPTEQKEIQVSVRVEGYDKTILSKQEIKLAAYDISHAVGNQDIPATGNPLAIHAIVKAFEEAEWDVTDTSQFDFGGGSYIQKLAGLKTFSVTDKDGWQFAVNNVPPSVGINAQVLQDGDEIVMYFSTDYTVDAYSYFTLKEVSNKQYKVQLLGISYDPETWAPVVNPVSDATIVIDGVASEYKTDENGLVTIQFATEGKHELTAIKKVGNYSIISRPYLAIDVNEEMIVTPEPTPVEPKPEIPEQPMPVVPPSAVTTLVEKTTNYLQTKVPTPTFGSEWAIVALARSHVNVPQSYYDNYLASVAETLKQSSGVLEGPRTEHSRLILALSAIGVDATNVGGYNVFAPLHDFEKVTGQGINGAIFALLAFNAQNYHPAVANVNRVASLTDMAATTVTTRENLVDYIVSKELAGGGFALGEGAADPDVTAMALQALAPYKTDADVAPVIDRGITKLASIQLNNAGYTSSGNENVQSAAQVLIALSTLKIDAATDTRFIKNGNTILDNIASFAVGDGGYKHPKNGAYSAMATEQATQALIAYDRFAKDLPGLFEMADVKVEETPIPTPTPTTPGTGGGAVTPAPVPTEQVAYIAITNKSYGDILAETEVKLNKGDTVYSVLKRVTDAKGITLNTRSSSYGKYVVGIAGIKEFDRGPLSGWMYRSNGDFPSYSSDSHKVNAGDYIEWVYTEDLGKDVGGYVPGIETQTPAPTTPGVTTGGGGGGAQKPGENPGTAPTTPVTENLATITAGQAKQNKPVVVEQADGSKVEVPAALLNNLQLQDNETLNVAVTQQDEQIQVKIEKAVDGKTSPVAAGKAYVKVTLPASATANTVVLQLVDGEYRAIPHRVVDGKIELKVKSSGTFIVTNEVVTFNDITTSGYKEDIEFLASRHVIKGKDAETFAPNDKVTRAQFAALVSRALGLQANEASSFTDTQGKWYESDVQALFEAGITTGKTATTFDPNANMTREQGAVFMARILEYVGYDAPPATALTFTDEATINEAYKAQIALLVQLGIMSGKEDGSFDAKGNLTRGQLAKMLTRTLKIAELM